MLNGDFYLSLSSINHYKNNLNDIETPMLT